MSSTQVPEVIKITKILEMRNLMKTLAFTILLRGEDIRSHKMFNSKIIKKNVCGPDVILGTSNQIKYQLGPCYAHTNPVRCGLFVSCFMAPCHC